MPATVKVAQSEAGDCSAKAQAEAATAAARGRTSRVNQPSWSITSVTAEAQHIAKMTARAPTPRRDDATRVVAQDTPSHRADAGMAWGTLIHGLLEHAMRHPNCDARRSAAAGDVADGRGAAVARGHRRGDRDGAAGRAGGVLGGGAGGRALGGGAVCGRWTAERLTNGVIDLLFESARAWQVVDYKTDMALDAAGYERQLETYREALRRVGCETADAALVHVRNE